MVPARSRTSSSESHHSLLLLLLEGDCVVGGWRKREEDKKEALRELGLSAAEHVLLMFLRMWFKDAVRKIIIYPKGLLSKVIDLQKDKTSRHPVFQSTPNPSKNKMQTTTKFTDNQQRCVKLSSLLSSLLGVKKKLQI